MPRRVRRRPTGHAGHSGPIVIDERLSAETLRELGSLGLQSGNLHNCEVDGLRLADGVIVLSQHELGDVEAHLAGEDEEQTRRFGWYPARSTFDSVRNAIEKWQAQWESSGATRTFAIRDVQTGALTGGCEIRLRERHIAEMSYWIFPRFRGRGFASRAVSLACVWAFDELGVARMELYVEPDNAASRTVAARAGFTEEGVLRAREEMGEERRDMVLYSRLPSDGSPSHPIRSATA